MTEKEEEKYYQDCSSRSVTYLLTVWVYNLQCPLITFFCLDDDYDDNNVDDDAQGK